MANNELNVTVNSRASRVSCLHVSSSAGEESNHEDGYLSAVLAAGMPCGCTYAPTETPFAQVDVASVVRVGMEFEEAHRILKAHNAREVIMAMAPPESPNGGHMHVVNYEIAGNRAIAIVHDRKDGKDLIVEMAVCDTLENPKAMKGWKEVQKIDVGNR